MQRKLSKIIGTLAGGAFLLGGVRHTQPFPPAPDHLFYGMVRDEMGNPLNFKDSEVVLETEARVQNTASIVNTLEPGVNYRLSVPMDAGITSDLYKATALKPSVPFKVWVRIKQVRYLPLEMKGDYSQLGQPGKRTRLNLTLGEDSDGDGLPDAWERALIAALGGKQTLSEINPNDDADEDGLTNLQEYLAGTYAFDSKDGFTLDIVGSAGPNSILEFLAVKGRTYRVLGSETLTSWTSVPFRLAGTTQAPGDLFAANDTRVLRIEAAPQSGAKLQFFKLMVQ